MPINYCLVPNLRFNKFHDKYITIPLKECLKIKSGKDQKQVECLNGKYKIYGTGGVIGTTNSYLYNKESVGIGRKGTIDKPFYFDKPFWTVDTLFYSEISNYYMPKYIYYLFQTIPWKKYNTSTGVPSLTSTTIEAIEKSFPSLEEQRKIAEFLSLIDERIETQIKIIEVKRLLKDLIIDNCIFKSNDCEYVEVYNFADLKNGYAFKSNNYTDCGKYKVITIGNVSGERYLNLNKLNYLTYIPLDIQKHQILKKGDLLISLTGNVGRISICNEENCLLNQRVGLIELFNVNDYEYLYQVMASKRFQNDMVLRAQGAAQPNIGKDDVLNYRIPYLNNLNKRKKISSVLRLLDNSILSDENLLITYNKQKQYLLRNLFI